MKRYLRLAGLVLALTPLAYPYGSLLEAAEASGKSPNGVRYHGGDEIILQGFHWNVVRTAPNNWYSTLASMAPSIAADGFSAIWMPVPWRDFSSWSDSSNGTSGGGEGYFWHDFNKNGRYGSDSLLKQAEVALYRAKEEGGNALLFFDAPMQAAVDARAALEMALRDAVEDRKSVV